MNSNFGTNVLRFFYYYGKEGVWHTNICSQASRSLPSSVVRCLKCCSFLFLALCNDRDKMCLCVRHFCKKPQRSLNEIQRRINSRSELSMSKSMYRQLAPKNLNGRTLSSFVPFTRSLDGDFTRHNYGVSVCILKFWRRRAICSLFHQRPITRTVAVDGCNWQRSSSVDHVYTYIE